MTWEAQVTITVNTQICLFWYSEGGISEVIVRVGQRMMEVEGSERMEKGAARDCCKKVPLPFERAIYRPCIMLLLGHAEF